MVEIKVKDGVMKIEIKGERNEVINELMNIDEKVKEHIATNVLISKGILSNKKFFG